MTTVLLVRHGETDTVHTILSGRASIGLNEAGRWQAETLARYFGPIAVDTVLSSPVERARQTAEAITSAKHLALQIDERLNEIDFGHWSGRSFAELDGDPLFSQWNSQRASCRAPGGERMQDVQMRAAELMAALCQTAELAIAVTHADVIKAVVCGTLGLSLNAHHRFAIDPASITTLRSRGQEWALVRLNEAPHG